MRHFFFANLIVISSLAAPATAAAQTPPPSVGDAAPPLAPTPEAPPPPPRHVVALTVAPFLLAFPLVELTGEARLGDRLSVALTAGAGSVGVTSFSFSNTGTFQDTTTHLPAYELGAQVRGYPIGSFEHGLSLAAEALYLYVNADKVENQYERASAEGLALSPLVGYKYTAPFGLTVDVQGGPAFLVERAHASTGTNAASENNATVVPRLRLNVGWSF